MSPLRCAQRLLKAKDQRGQIAVAFLVVMALAVLLASSTMNIGEVARLKTATANASDAGVLAGTSWIASGENAIALVAQAMWTNIVMLQAIFALPFCYKVLWVPPYMALQITLINLWLWRIANHAMKSAWEIGKAAALFTTISNLWIDDGGASPARGTIKAIQDQYTATHTVPNSVRLDWTRPGLPGQWAQINVQYPPDTVRPELTVTPKRVVAFMWSPPFCFPFFFCCWGPAPGWVAWPMFSFLAPAILALSTTVPWRPGRYLGAAWGVLALTVPSWFRPTPGVCKDIPPFGTLTCFPIPLLQRVIGPDRIQNALGPELRVTVTQHREDRNILPFWNMQYPAQILSEGRARYTAATVGFWPDPKSLAQLSGGR